MLRWLLLLIPLIVLAISCSSSGGDDDDTDDDASTDDDQADDDADDDAADDDTVDDDEADDDTAEPDCTQTVVRGNLEWSMCDNGADINHPDAETYVAQLDLGGHTDWRLPTVAELKALYNESREIDTDCYIPAHIDDPFVLTCVWVWSSQKTDAFGEEIAMAFGFSHGSKSPWGGDVSANIRALAVRDVE
jgi:hypothetical protein